MTNPFSSARGLLGLVFLGGIALGAWSMRLYFDHTLKSWDPAERFTAQLTADLKLNQDQKRQVAVILTDQKRSMEDLRDRWKADVRLLARGGEDQIARILTPGQTDEFMRQHDRIHGRMDRFLWMTDTSPTALAAVPLLP
jgi:hypothetical protein